MNSKDVGKYTEQECLKMLSQKGYWCHFLEKNRNGGQPCDIVIAKDDSFALIDVKHCEGARFEFKNIQPNQRTCFELALSVGIKKVGFIIYFEVWKSFKWLHYKSVKELEKMGNKGISLLQCCEVDDVL